MKAGLNPSDETEDEELAEFVFAAVMAVSHERLITAL